MRKTLIIIPAFNEATKLGKVIDSIRNIYKKSMIDICIIDDGSKDNTYKVAKNKQVKVFRHILNRGLGVALGTGFEYAKKHNYNIVVTFDADGQHKVVDINRLIKPIIQRKADVAIGVRIINQKKMPMLRRLINSLSNIATYILFGVWTTDSQSGLRAFNAKALNLIKLKSERMEVSSEIFKEIGRNKLKLIEIPIQPIYTNYSLNKGQRVTNATNVMWKLIINEFSNL